MSRGIEALDRIAVNQKVGDARINVQVAAKVGGDVDRLARADTDLLNHNGLRGDARDKQGAGEECDKSF